MVSWNWPILWGLLPVSSSSSIISAADGSPRIRHRIEVEMRIYEEDVNKALIATADREGKTIDVQ